MNDPIRAEVARAELDDLGAKHFLDVRATVRRMLEDLPKPARARFALAAAERVLTHVHPNRAEEVAPILRAVRRGLEGDGDANADVAVAVGRFYLSPDWRRRQHDDPVDLDDHAMMATLYTAECYLHGCLEFACWAGWRGFDAAAVAAAGDSAWPHRRPVEVSLYSWELAHPTIQTELERQLEDVERVGQSEVFTG